MPAGSTITYTLVANISGSAPANLREHGGGDATGRSHRHQSRQQQRHGHRYRDHRHATGCDLGITKSGWQRDVPRRGSPVTYTICVSQRRTLRGATGASVLSIRCARGGYRGDLDVRGCRRRHLSRWASGSGDISVVVNLPAGASVTFTLVRNGLRPPQSGNLVNARRR